VLFIPTTLARKDRNVAAKNTFGEKKKAFDLFKINPHRQAHPKPVLRKAEGFGVTPPVRDLPAVAPNVSSAKLKASEVEDELEKEKVENDRVKVSTGLKSDFRADLRADVFVPNAMPTPLLT